jgi:hypothetical protein
MLVVYGPSHTSKELVSVRTQGIAKATQFANKVAGLCYIEFKLTPTGRKVDLSNVILLICVSWKIRSQSDWAVSSGNGVRIAGMLFWVRSPVKFSVLQVHTVRQDKKPLPASLPHGKII